MAEQQQVQVLPCPTVERFVDSAGDLHLLPGPSRTPMVIANPFGVPVADLLDRAESDPSLLVQSRSSAELPWWDELCQQMLDARLLRQRRDLELCDPGWGTFDRQMRCFAESDVLPVLAQSRLATARVLVLGLGGVGSAVADMLARAGTGVIVAVDHDVVATENLPRQSLYDINDVGFSKVDRATRRIRRISTTTAVVPVERRISSAQELEHLLRVHQPSLVVSSADTPFGQFSSWLDQACFARGVPYITAAQRPPFAFAGPFCVPGTTPCMSCVTGPTSDERPDLQLELARARDHSDFIVPAMGLLDQLAACLVVADCCSWITGTAAPALLNRRIAFDVTTMQSTPESGDRRRCDLCSTTSRTGEAAA